MIGRMCACILICAGVMSAQKPDEQSVNTAVEAYRRMWQAMSADQRKAMVDAGGATPERYERTLRMQLSGAARSAAPSTGDADQRRTIKTDLTETVRTSAEDLDAIRDANLVRLRDEACPPEIALEVAALRSSFSPAAMPSQSALLGIAATWLQRVEETPATAEQSNRRAIDQLLGVPAPPAVPADRARVTAELERRLAACKK